MQVTPSTEAAADPLAGVQTGYVASSRPKEIDMLRTRDDLQGSEVLAARRQRRDRAIGAAERMLKQVRSDTIARIRAAASDNPGVDHEASA
jgi:hypothetical protein